MNKTLYIRDEDAEIWDRARKIAPGGKLSPIIVEALRRYAEGTTPTPTLMERVSMLEEATKSRHPLTTAQIRDSIETQILDDIKHNAHGLRKRLLFALGLTTRY